MSELLFLIVVIAAGYSAYRQAQAKGEWSWVTFAWVLLLAVIDAVAIAFFAVCLGTWLGPDDALLATVLLLLIIAASLVPLTIAAKRIQNRYRRRA